ncbi:MAG: polymer-forming cytoskeletal protein [Sandaracinaceae bacterium]
MSKESLLPEGIALAGSIEGTGDLVVAGAIDGPIDLEGWLTIEASGRVTGDVQVTGLIVRGILIGQSLVRDTLRIEASAKVVGDARAGRVQIEDGARVRGRVQMTDEDGRAPGSRKRRRRGRDPEERAPREHDREDRAATRRARRPAEERALREPAPEAPGDEPAAGRRARRERSRPASKRRSRQGPPEPTIPTVGRQRVQRRDVDPDGSGR